MNKCADATGTGCALVFLLFWSVCTLLFDYVVVRDIGRQWKTSDYLETVGTITHAEVKFGEDPESSDYPLIRYAYSVDDQQYTGDVYRFTPPLMRVTAIHRLVRENPIGKSVPVYYCAKEPYRAVLRRGLQVCDFYLPLSLVPFNGIMLLGFYGMLKNKIQRFFRNERHWFRDFPIQDDGQVIRLRISSHDLFASTIVGTIPTNFLTMPLFMFDAVDVNVIVLLGWGLVVCGGLLGFWLAVHKNHSDLFVLTVDKTCNVIILPRQPDKTPGPTVPFDAIEHMAISTAPVSSSDERENHILTLVYRDGAETKSTVVASNHNRVGFFHYIGFPDDDRTELTELKNWILKETGR